MAINCLFDTGSFVKNSVHEALNLKGPLESVSIEPLGSSGGGCKRVRRVKMCLSPIKDHEIRRQLIEALCLRKISESPNLRLEIKQFSHLAQLKLAEDFTNLYTSFDVLIGLDYYYEFIDQKIIKDQEGEP
ncbi:Large ribosomal subunit protein [Trichinella spiralis]|uniref:Large ribosomal subunit protein n=1 Tax=Trichinella spiralis TaxID=6334 RepID=A0ABR3KS95_TRISP